MAEPDTETRPGERPDEGDAKPTGSGSSLASAAAPASPDAATAVAPSGKAPSGNAPSGNAPVAAAPEAPPAFPAAPHEADRDPPPAKRIDTPPMVAVPVPQPPILHTPPMPMAPVRAPAAAQPQAVSTPHAPHAPAIATSGGPAGHATDRPAAAAYEALARSPRLSDLVVIAQKVLGEAATMRTAPGDGTAKVAEAAEEVRLTRAEADTPFGNALQILQTGPEGAAERALACALAAHAVAELQLDDEDKVAGDLLWLATHTPFDATPLLDRALGEEAGDLWRAIGSRVQRIDEGRGSALGRGEALVGALAIAASTSPVARSLARELSARSKDPTLAQLLRSGQPGAGDATDVVRIEGEMVSAPRGPIATALLGFSGILLLVHGASLAGRLALAYRRPAEVSFSDAGVRILTRTEMLGRVLFEREHVIARASLVRVVREVRYPRVAFYAGLLALALGSYVGVRILADGVRAASPSLLLFGLVIVALGIGADFLLGTVVPGALGMCRVAFVPRAGATLCVGRVDAARADAAIAQTLRAPKP